MALIATIYCRDLGQGLRWYAYNKGVIGSFATLDEAIAELRAAGWVPVKA